MRRIIALLLSSCLSANALAQTCNTQIPWYTNFGTMALGNTPQLGPNCNQFQDSGININTLSNNTTASINNLQAQINAIHGLTLLNTLTASNSASLSDTTSLTSAFSQYEIIYTNLLPSVVGPVSISMQVQSGGTFQSASYIANELAFNATATGVTSSTAAITIMDVNVGSAGPGVSGKVEVGNPSGTTNKKGFYGYSASQDTGGLPRMLIISGFWNGGSGAVTGFQFFPSSGLFASGTIRIYGRP